MKVLEKIKIPLIFIVLAGLVVGYYVYLTHKPKNTEINPGSNSPAAAVLARDLNLNYPGTARSVITYYCDILKVIYKTQLSADEFTGIVAKLQGIYDDELLAYNGYGTYSESLKAEIAEYKANDRYVGDYKVEENYNIVYKTLSDQKKYAYVEVILYIRTGNKSIPIYEEFTLRQDEDGRWKILTWKAEEATDWEKQP